MATKSSDYKVNVSVQFNAIMNDIDNAVKKLKDGIEGLTKTNGQKGFFEGVVSDVDTISQKLEKLRNTTITPTNFNQFQANLQEINGLIDKVRQNLENAPKADFIAKIAEQEAKIAELRALKEKEPENAKKLDQQIRGHELAIKNYTRQQEQANIATKNAADVLDKQGNAADQTDKELEDFVRTNQELTNEKIADTIQTQVNRYIGLAAIYRYTKKYLQDLIQTYKEFDESLVAIAAVTGQTRDQMWANISVYNKMAQSLGTTTQEVINASKLYYQQGLTTTSVLKLTEETVKLATIAELDSADATEYLTTAMNGFKLSAEESTRVTDVWANLAAKTASDVDELAIAISKVASLAENAGMEIETASAFLNQMIETTREAPENLGTALKTIIARFQELKTSEEELSDGVDANKVEKALKTAGVALRDVNGQFRDFDDVILELSSKWDGLDRNTQRYIATIAAGSRQQSRFIALVSDYEGLLRNVNYAYDSLGSADAQMAVFQEGLTASTNRLQAAWEGLYTSWSESATVISKLIDGMASFVSTLADLGAGWSAFIAILGVLITTILANATANAINNKEMLEGIGITQGLTDAYNGLITKQIENLKLTIAAAAPYIALAAAITVLTVALIKYITYNNEYLKSREKEAQILNQTAAREKDAASSLGVLITEIEDAKKSNEDLSNIQQKIIDQFGDEIKATELLGLNYDQLIAKLRELQGEKERQAAVDYIRSAQTRSENDFLEEALGQGKGKAIGFDRKNGIIYENAYAKRGNVIGMDEKGKLQYSTVYVYRGKEYNDIPSLQAAMGKDIGFDSILTAGESKFIAKSIIDSEEIDKEFKTSQAAVESFVNYLDKTGKIGDLFDDDNNVTKEYSSQIQTITTEIENLYNTIEKEQGSEAAQSFIDFLQGNYGQLNAQQITQFQAVIANVSNNEWSNIAQDNAQTYINGLRQKWQEAFPELNPVLINIGVSWAGTLQQAFLQQFESADTDIAAAAVWWVDTFQEETGKALSSLDGDELWRNYIDAIAEAGESGISDKLRDAFANILDFSEVSFDHPVEQVKNLSDALSQLSEVASDGLDISSFIDLITDLSVQMDNATIATLTEGMAIDATTGKVQLNEDAARALAEAKIAQARGQMEAGLAAAQEQKAIVLAAIGMRQEQKSAGELGETSVGLAQDASMAAQAWEILKRALTDRSYSWGQAIADLLGLSSTAQNLTSKAKALAQSEISDEELYAELEKAEGLINIYNAGIESLNNIDLDSYISNTTKSGSSTSKANDASKDYLKTLKNLAKQLKDTADEAEAAAKREIAAILAVLEAQKDALEKRQDELEKSRTKQVKELELWIKAQIQILENLRDERQKAFDDEEDALELQADAAEEAYKRQIQAIQDQIDALDKQAEAEDRILKLQKARDEYNKAQNSKTRLVLTKGAGWIFKTDQNAIDKARDSLRAAEREYQKSVLEDQKEQLQAQADLWKEIAEGIGKSAKEIAELNNAIEKFFNNVDGYADISAYETAVTAHQAGRDQINFDNDENTEGSIAYQIKELEDALDKISRSFDEQLTAEAFEGILAIVQSSDDTKGLLETTNSILNNVSNYMTRFSAAAKEYADNALKIEDLEETIELWKNIDDNIGLTTTEIADAEKLYKKYNDAFNKKGTEAFNAASDYYKAMLSQLDELAKLFQKADDAQKEVTTYEQATQGGFSTGGVVDFYGPADLHGTIAEPEVVFNARQASALFNWVKSLSGYGIPQINGMNPTPVATVNNNSKLSNDIYINELNVNSTADSFDSLVVDIRRYSPMVNGI